MVGGGKGDSVRRLRVGVAAAVTPAQARKERAEEGEQGSTSRGGNDGGSGGEVWCGRRWCGCRLREAKARVAVVGRAVDW